MHFRPSLIYLAVLCFLVFSCKNDSNDLPLDLTLDIRLKEDPRNINPVLYNGSVARLVHQYIFLPLADYHPETLEIIPILIKSIPEKEFSEGDKVSYSIELKEDATWDNGDPISAQDYLFTLKVILHPQSPSSFYRGFFQDLEKVELNGANPQSFVVTFAKDYLLSRDAVLSIPILPQKVYDPDNLMDELSIDQLKDEEFMTSFMANNEAFSAYIADMKGPKYGKEIIDNSGPYRLKSWELNQSIVLEKKANYWGQKYPDNPYLQQGPETIQFYVIPDETTVISQLKAGVLDVSNAISKNNFTDLKDNEVYGKEFTFFSPTLTRYYYLLVNNQDPILSDPAVRRALAYLLDIDKIIENLDQGYGTRTSSLVHPVKSYYNENLQPIPFDPGKAASILQASGWKDIDQDGDLDKNINGVQKELSIDMYVNEGELGKNVALLLQENGKQVGLNINIITKPFSTIFREHVLKRDFGLTPFSASLGPELDDFYQSWHSDNADPGESNLSGYRDEEADQIIEEIRTTRDASRRSELYRNLQAVVQEDMPVIFMYAPTETIIVSNRWNGSVTAKRPGFLANTFVPNK